jgi:hypothetical protein
MGLNTIKGLYDISKEVLNEKGINNISFIRENSNTKMMIKYKNGDIETIEDILEIERIIQNLKNENKNRT